MALETKIMIIVGIGSGIILGIPFTPIICLIRHVLIVPFKHKKILEKAKRDGHVVKAKLIKWHDAPSEWGDGSTDSSRYIGLYVWEYNGKSIKHTLKVRHLYRKNLHYILKEIQEGQLEKELWDCMKVQ